jgi:hypothetical protein
MQRTVKREGYYRGGYHATLFENGVKAYTAAWPVPWTNVHESDEEFKEHCRKTRFKRDAELRDWMKNGKLPTVCFRLSEEGRIIFD